MREIRGSRDDDTHVQVVDGFALCFQLENIVAREGDPENLLNARNTQYSRYNQSVVNMKEASETDNSGGMNGSWRRTAGSLCNLLICSPASTSKRGSDMLPPMGSPDVRASTTSPSAKYTS